MSPQGGGGGGYNPQGRGTPWSPQGYGQPQGNGPPMGGNYGPQNNSWQPQSGAGGYNPQPMGGAPYSPGPPGWDMRLAAGGQDYRTASQPYLTPDAPDWLKLQMGQAVDQPWAVDPSRYGRWNWGTNMQGGGIPSPFGQYAQQYGQYNPLQFPPPPNNGGPGGGGPGPGSGPPAPPPGPPQPPPLIQGLGQQAIQAGSLGGYNSAQYQQNLKAAGSQEALNPLVNGLSPGGWTMGQGPGGQGYNPGEDQRFLQDRNANLSAYGMHWDNAAGKWSK